MPKYTVYYNKLRDSIELVTEFKTMYTVQFANGVVLLVSHASDRKIFKKILKEPIVYKRLGSL